MAFFRYYLPFAGRAPFLQADLGSAVFWEFDDIIPIYAGALAIGWRFQFSSGWYLELAGRFGYPFMWSAGLATGFQFKYGGRQ